MAMIICSECGKEISDKASSCPNCGATVNITSIPSTKHKQKNKASKIPIILTAIGGIILAIIVGISVRIIDGQTLLTGETKLSTLRSELESVSLALSSSKAELSKINAQIEKQNKKIEPLKDIYDFSLVAGKYTVGIDLEPGIYHFTYTLKDPNESWGDYLYITYADSNGTNETLGGTEFDYRIEAEDDGEQVSIKLDTGSTLFVETDYGNWNPGKKPTSN